MIRRILHFQSAVTFLGALGLTWAAAAPLVYEGFEKETLGTIHGGVSFVTDVVGYGGLGEANRSSAHFDGRTGTSLSYGPEIRVTGTDFTVEAFVKPEKVNGYATIAAQWSEEGDQRAWAVTLAPGGGVRFDVMPHGKFHDQNSLTTARRLLRAGEWYHVAAVCQGDASRVYINGRLQAEARRPAPGIFNSGVVSLKIGNADSFSDKPRPFTGLLDEVRITQRALEPREFLHTREPMPEIKGPVPERYEMPFAATSRGAALDWQHKARKKLFDLVSAQTPRRSLAERPLDFRIDSSEDKGAYSLHHASFLGNDGGRRNCLWAVPKGAGPFPAVLSLHGHGGSAELVFDAKGIYGAFADRLARGGYCILAPSFPHRDYAASTLWDLIRGVDILAAQKEVDAKRIGVMGLSMGGEWTMWAAACDQRLKVAVVSGWMCTTEGVFAVPNCPCWELPGFVELMDVCEVNLLIAPRPVLFESAEGDPCFPIRYTREGFDRIRAGYKVFGAQSACAQDVFPGGHMISGKEAYSFVDRALGGHAAAAK